MPTLIKKVAAKGSLIYLRLCGESTTCDREIKWGKNRHASWIFVDYQDD
jgi:hypothetical protein